MADRHPLRDRHRLAQHLHDTARARELDDFHTGHAGAFADAVIEVGWRPPAHEIAEPNELPIGSIVLRDGNAWQRGKQCWWMAGTRAKSDKPHGSGPITALYIPTEEATDGE
ncbi:hypothetical protein [Nocardia gipuzkoensis]|uniref:hypothetical protein n=1 Tax=Nocardia gipuzkoensis TaxID=2749991 RepID=UPI00237E16A4|nr:hypothetical protein [Nocardia gipuzkoensis]MDE1673809.1 hypothetical protein [Nocardia gipuzkoensis]